MMRTLLAVVLALATLGLAAVLASPHEPPDLACWKRTGAVTLCGGETNSR